MVKERSVWFDSIFPRDCHTSNLMKQTVLIPSDISEPGKAYLRDHGYAIKMGRGVDEDSILEDIQDCDALLARNERISRRIIEHAPRLKVIAKHGVGMDKIDLAAARDAKIWVTNGPTSNTTAVAEHSVLLILSCAKRLVFFDRAVRAGDYEIRNRVKGMDLDGKTVAIIGMGKIGMQVAAKCHLGFHMKIVGYDPYLNPDAAPDYVTLCGKMQDAVSRADFVSLHLPATDDNAGFFNKDYFSIMKPTAYFINAARGSIVNEKDLYDACKKRQIAGAGLDVYAEEPFNPQNPLFTLDNVILTPHNAALTQETTDRMGLHAAQGIDEVLSGKTPTWPVVIPM